VRTQPVRCGDDAFNLGRRSGPADPRFRGSGVSSNCQVTAITDPIQALTVAARLRRVDLLIVDSVMPPLPGNELAQCLGRGRPGMGVVYISVHPAVPNKGHSHLSDETATYRGAPSRHCRDD